GEDYVVWDSYEPVVVNRVSARRLLWDLVRFADAEAQDILEYIKYWGGLYDYSERPAFSGDQRTSFPLDRWVDFAGECEILLRTLAVTEAGKLADDDLANALFWL